MASVKIPPTFLIEKLRAIKIEIKRGTAAIIELIPNVVACQALINDIKYHYLISNAGNPNLIDNQVTLVVSR